jgi:hypothetical protein
VGMENYKIGLFEILSEAVSLTKRYFIFGLPLLIFSMITSVGPIALRGLGLTDRLTDSIHNIVGILGFLIYVTLYVGFGNLALKAARGNIPKWEMFRVPVITYIQISVVGFTCMLLGGLAFLLLIVPGVILMLMWSQVYLILLDGKASWFESLSFSKKLTSGNKISLLKLFFLMIIISIPFLALTMLIIKLSLPDVSQLQAGASLALNQTPLIDALNIVSSLLMPVIQMFNTFVGAITYHKLLAKLEIKNSIPAGE